MEECNESNVEEKKVQPVKKKTERRRRKLKPADYPKRPLSAYNIFFMETRDELVEEMEKAGETISNFQVIVKAVAQRWKILPKENRERVEKLAKKDLLRYKAEVRTYEAELAKRGSAKSSSQSGTPLHNSSESSKVLESMDKSALGSASAGAGGGSSSSSAAAAGGDSGAAAPLQIPMSNEMRQQLLAGKSYIGTNSGVSGALDPMTALRLRGEHSTNPSSRLVAVLEEELRMLDAAREVKVRQLAEARAAASAMDSTPLSGLSDEAHSHLMMQRLMGQHVAGGTSSGGRGGGAPGSSLLPVLPPPFYQQQPPSQKSPQAGAGNAQSTGRSSFHLLPGLLGHAPSAAGLSLGSLLNPGGIGAGAAALGSHQSPSLGGMRGVLSEQGAGGANSPSNHHSGAPSSMGEAMNPLLRQFQAQERLLALARGAQSFQHPAAYSAAAAHLALGAGNAGAGNSGSSQRGSGQATMMPASYGGGGGGHQSDSS
eukprot:Nitzschia sp. Nitz4//scaffold99_size76975//20703//22157//NITZ4_005569-RA/size76975-processed-gene-0.26-mRNA-1//1//CDS//3329560829//7692//frame0